MLILIPNLLFLIVIYQIFAGLSTKLNLIKEKPGLHPPHKPKHTRVLTPDDRPFLQ